MGSRTQHLALTGPLKQESSIGGSIVLMGEGGSSWVGWGPGGPSREVSHDERDEFIRSREEQVAARGELMAVVEAYVFEHGDCDTQIIFPPGCKLGPDADSERLTAVVAIAREALATWR
jgi:hypothetical protein